MNNGIQSFEVLGVAGKVGLEEFTTIFIFKTKVKCIQISMKLYTILKLKGTRSIGYGHS